jgi:hypothetical protein
LIRGLREHHQTAAVQFYIDLYSAILKYHTNMSHCESVVSIFCVYAPKDALWSEIEIAFDRFKAEVKNTSSYQN